MTPLAIHRRLPGADGGRYGSLDRVTEQVGSYERRMHARMKRDKASGLIFFKGPVEAHIQEMKLGCGRFVITRWVAGGDNMCHMLRRPESFDWGRRKFRLSGEFLHQYGPTLYTVISGKVRIVMKMLSVSLPLENEDVLKRFLSEALRNADGVEPTGTASRSGRPIPELSRRILRTRS